MTAPAQIAVTPDRKRAGIRAHGRVVWLPEDFARPVVELLERMEAMQAAHERWQEAFRRAEEEAMRGE